MESPGTKRQHSTCSFRNKISRTVSVDNFQQIKKMNRARSEIRLLSYDVRLAFFNNKGNIEMKTASIRLLSSLVLMTASFSALAGQTGVKALEVKGVFNEKVGPSLQCVSLLGGKLAGHGEADDGTPVAFVGGDCFAQFGTTFIFSNGKFILLYPNGDQIFANYSGQFVPTGAGTAYVMNGGTFTITGGSGTYSNALGGGYLTGTEDLSNGAGTIGLSGRVYYKLK